ncbi:hypothetical protein CEXT_733901 [Caerostris extrusa]|uniref:Uncharacterized protein n=1 Tax=Caerostris extrusa TaxID=172846 RepID=A0AAV4WBG6_CAEEX|nr:hypothetical protein CEXT_733901 [Caerostris extrusa]
MQQMPPSTTAGNKASLVFIDFPIPRIKCIPFLSLFVRRLNSLDQTLLIIAGGGTHPKAMQLDASPRNCWEQGLSCLHRFPNTKNKTHSISLSLCPKIEFLESNASNDCWREAHPRAVQQMHPPNNWWEEGFPFRHRFLNAKNKLSLSLCHKIEFLGSNASNNCWRPLWPQEYYRLKEKLSELRQSDISGKELTLSLKGSSSKGSATDASPQQLVGTRFPFLYRFPDAKNKTHSIPPLSFVLILNSLDQTLLMIAGGLCSVVPFVFKTTDIKMRVMEIKFVFQEKLILSCLISEPTLKSNIFFVFDLIKHWWQGD